MLGPVIWLIFVSYVIWRVSASLHVAITRRGGWMGRQKVTFRNSPIFLPALVVCWTLLLALMIVLWSMAAWGILKIVFAHTRT